MYYQLADSQQKFLIAQPETGMGYQLVIAQRRGTNLESKFLVLNAEIAVEMDEATSLCVKEILTEGMRVIKRKALDFRWDITSVVQHVSKLRTTNPITENKIEYPDGAEVFVRVSVYETDLRIDTVNNCLRPGSYTTTLHDYLKYRHASEDPMIQIALQHGVQPQWAFHIQPKRNDALQRSLGDARNGAKEIYFPEGTSHSTFLHRKPYLSEISHN